MNKKIISLMIALVLPLTTLVGCKKSSTEEFIMTEDTTALDGSVEYSANTYKDAFYSTSNYSNDYLQQELESIVKEITSDEDKEELVELLNNYAHPQNGNLNFVKSCFEKYNDKYGNSQNTTLESNGLYEISSRLYKATLNATKKYYDINDFYVYYKEKLINSSHSIDDEEFENEVKMTAIKEYTIANIYKNAYHDSFISKLITYIENESSKNDETEVPTENIEDNQPKEDNEQISENTPSKEEEKEEDKEDNSDNNSDDIIDDSEETYPEYIELSEAVKSQIYDAGVNAAIEFISQNSSSSSLEFCKQVFDDLENDNSLGDNKEEGYSYFLDGFKTTLENNNVAFE